MQSGRRNFGEARASSARGLGGVQMITGGIDRCGWGQEFASTRRKTKTLLQVRVRAGASQRPTRPPSKSMIVTSHAIIRSSSSGIDHVRGTPHCEVGGRQRPTARSAAAAVPRQVQSLHRAVYRRGRGRCATAKPAPLLCAGVTAHR